MNKCVLFYRVEKWNKEQNKKLLLDSIDERCNLFYTMDYFDFCLSIEPETIEELLGRYEQNEEIRKKISTFNKISSSKQIFSLCNGITEEDPFKAEKKYLIITIISLNYKIYEEECNNINDLINSYKEIVQSILKEKCQDEEVYNIYNLLSNEDFCVVLACNNLSVYYYEILPLIRSKKIKSNKPLFSYTYSIQGYKINYDPNIDDYSLYKGKGNSDSEVVLRARLSTKYWNRYSSFPIIKNGNYRLSNSYHTIGKYNIIIKMEEWEFLKIANYIIDRKLGLEDKKSSKYKEDLSIISKREDIIKYIEYNYFSYINERIILQPKNNIKYSFQNDITLNRREITEKLKKICDVITDINKKQISNKEIRNDLYRLFRICEHCTAMARNTYLIPTIYYIVDFIDLFLKEIKANWNVIKQQEEKENVVPSYEELILEEKARFEEYIKEGLKAISTVFEIFTNRIYDNIQAPNYDIDYTFATEKILIAYAQILTEFCVKYRDIARSSGKGSNSMYRPLLIPNSMENSLSMKILFTDSAIRKTGLKIKQEDDMQADNGQDQRILLINCPFDSRILECDIYLPLLFHELGHYMRPENRAKRNKVFARIAAKEMVGIISVKFNEFLEQIGIYEITVDIYKEIRETFFEKLKILFESFAEDVLFDTYKNQIIGIFSLLTRSTEKYHIHLEYELKKFYEALGEDYIEKKNKLEVLLQLQEGYKKLSEILNRKDNVNIQIINIFDKENDIYRAKELQTYKTICGEIKERIRDDKKRADDELLDKLIKILKEKGNLESEEIEIFIKSINLNEEKEIKKLKRIVESYLKDKTYLMLTNGFFDFQEKMGRIILKLNSILDDVENCSTSLNITEEIEKIQENFLGEVFQTLLKRTEQHIKEDTSSIYIEPILRKIGIIDSDETKFKEVFKRIFYSISSEYMENIDKSKHYFREAMADYVMCEVSKYTPVQYLEKYSQSIIGYNTDINDMRVALVLYMYYIDEKHIQPEEYISQVFRSLDNINNLSEKNIKSQFLQFHRDADNEFIENIKSTQRLIKKVVVEFNVEDYVKKPKEINDYIEFVLKYFYEARFNQFRIGEEGNKNGGNI